MMVQMVTKFDSLYLYASLANAKQEMNVLIVYDGRSDSRQIFRELLLFKNNETTSIESL